MEEEWVLPDTTQFSKAKWSPFAGMNVKGCVKRVVLRGEVVYIDGAVIRIIFFTYGSFRIKFLLLFQIIAQPGFGQDIRDFADKTNFSIPHVEFSDHGDPRITRSAHAGQQHGSTEGQDDIHFHRHTSETRELYGQMFSELGIPKLRSLSLGRSPQSLRMPQHPEPVPRPTSPIHRGPEVSLLSPPSQLEGGKKTLAVRPTSPCSVPGPSVATAITSHQHHHQHGLFGQSILTVDMFSKEQLNAVFNLAQTFRLCVQKERSLDHILKVKL